MKVLEVIWISTLTGQLGIVLTENMVGEKKARIGMVKGVDQKADIEHIMEFGGKINASDALNISNHLNGEKEDV